MYCEADMTRLVEAMRRTGTGLLEVEGADDFLRLVLPETGAELCGPQEAAAKPILERVKSPGLGRFAACGQDDGLTPLTIGAAIPEGQILGYVAEGGARLPVLAPERGVLTAALAQDGQIVGYGDVLFELELEA